MLATAPGIVEKRLGGSVSRTSGLTLALFAPSSLHGKKSWNVSHAQSCSFKVHESRMRAVSWTFTWHITETTPANKISPRHQTVRVTQS